MVITRFGIVILEHANIARLTDLSSRMVNAWFAPMELTLLRILGSVKAAQMECSGMNIFKPVNHAQKHSFMIGIITNVFAQPTCLMFPGAAVSNVETIKFGILQIIDVKNAPLIDHISIMENALLAMKELIMMQLQENAYPALQISCIM